MRLFIIFWIILSLFRLGNLLQLHLESVLDLVKFCRFFWWIFFYCFSPDFFERCIASSVDTIVKSICTIELFWIVSHRASWIIMFIKLTILIRSTPSWWHALVHFVIWSINHFICHSWKVWIHIVVSAHIRISYTIISIHHFSLPSIHHICCIISLISS
jgi:hypothetical protein